MKYTDGLSKGFTCGEHSWRGDELMKLQVVGDKDMDENHQGNQNVFEKHDHLHPS